MMTCRLMRNAQAVMQRCYLSSDNFWSGPLSNSTVSGSSPVLRSAVIAASHSLLQTRTLTTSLFRSHKLPSAISNKIPSPDGSNETVLQPQTVLQQVTPAPSADGNSSIIPESKEAQLSLVKSECNYYKQEGMPMPSQLSDSQWQQLADTKSAKGREKRLRYHFLTEIRKAKDKQRGKDRRLHSEIAYAQIKEELKNENRHISYGLWRNTYFIKFSDQYMDNINHHKLVTSALHGQSLIFDNSFDSHMNIQERKNLVQQLLMCIGRNRRYKEPFYLHMCNFDLESETAKWIMQGHSDIFMGLHRENYLDLFPKDRLVYLTPHANETMGAYDHNAIYIIGNIIEKGESVPLPLAKAKAEGIKMKKLPLDVYLDWGQGSKSLPLNQVMGIMLEMKETGSWVTAFSKNIPTRKLIKQDHGKVDNFKKSVRDNRQMRDYFKSRMDD